MPVVNIVVAGSIATDHLMVFPGKFSEQLVEGQFETISLSFLVDELEIRRGGVAANIAFGLGCFGLRPVLVGAVGRDFQEYREWLEAHNVDTDSVHVSESRHTARFLCTTDADQNQIASFYPGAMTEARDIELQRVEERLGRLDLVVIAPDDPEAMLRHTKDCRRRGYPFAADPSQQLPRLDSEQIRSLVDGAAYLFTNEYERGLLEHKAGWSTPDILERVNVLVQTRGPKPVMVERKGEPVVSVAPPQDPSIADPTGVGDAFRAGFLAGVAGGLGDERCAQLGCIDRKSVV